MVKIHERKFVSADPEKCVGCQICEYACSFTKEKAFNPLKSRIRVVRVNQLANMAVTCRLCEDPACVAGLDTEFPQKAQKGVILVGGKNFGCGSSREQAPLALKYSGVKCVVAESFARIFFRNAINIGLPVIECKGISTAVKTGDELAVDFEAGKVENLSNGKKFQVEKLPPFIIEILADGGLIENLRRKMKK